MTTLSQARQALQRRLEGYQAKRSTRLVYLGDGRGTAESNMRVPGRADYIYVRESLTDKRFFQVLNRARVQPAFNLPVIIGYSDEEPTETQVLGVHYGGLGQGTTGANITPLGPHRVQHQFRGGDEVYIDSRLFLPGLVHPTSPASMQVEIEEFIYFYDTWRQFDSTTSVSLTTYQPGAGSLYLMIALDPGTQSLVYRPGPVFTVGFGTIGFEKTPAPSGDEIPLGIIFLSSTTTSVDWTASADLLTSGRLLLGMPQIKILNRLQQLEGLSGNEPNLAALGAGTDTVSSNSKTINVRRNSTGSVLTRSQINFIEGTNITLTVSDDEVVNEADITISTISSAANIEDVRRYAYLLG